MHLLVVPPIQYLVPYHSSIFFNSSVFGTFSTSVFSNIAYFNCNELATSTALGFDEAAEGLAVGSFFIPDVVTFFSVSTGIVLLPAGDDEILSRNLTSFFSEADALAVLELIPDELLSLLLFPDVRRFQAGTA
jgi:hypothetical protein